MAPTSQPASNPMVTMETSMGMVKIELFKDQTPLTVENFLKLAREGFYDGVIFHRVIPNFMAQTGDPNSKDADPYNDGTGGPGYTFNDELVKNLSNVRGTMSMANRGPNTNGSQFFINIVDNTFLDGRHAVFGKVIEGLDIVDKIVNVPTRKDDPRLKDRPVKDVKIIKVSIAN
ncbi:MAG: peptidylprolyl isomerase [Candidatus Abawacabacteria bacterium]|nr:peptidylprolyl isomerase [Candidatus Abawacabacteria bacterium]